MKPDTIQPNHPTLRRAGPARCDILMLPAALPQLDRLGVAGKVRLLDSFETARFIDVSGRTFRAWPTRPEPERMIGG
jgi:hypothetical protein